MSEVKNGVEGESRQMFGMRAKAAQVQLITNRENWQ